MKKPSRFLLDCLKYAGGGFVGGVASLNPTKGGTQELEIYNFTSDAHPIHLHLVRFEVTGRAAIPGFLPVNRPFRRGRAVSRIR